MQKSKIEWTDYSYNPIKGICPVDCKLPDGRSYCYARRIYQRFDIQKWTHKHGDLWNNKSGLFLSTSELISPWLVKKPARIFLCSTIELFHPDIPKSWRDNIFCTIEERASWHTYQILTKFPQNIDRPMPDNVWLGITLTGTEKFGGFNELKHFEYKVKAKLKFISHEPLLFEPMTNIGFVDWIIVGRLTQHGKKSDPPKEWIESIVESARRNGTPIFLKNNLKRIWGDVLIQEFPK